MSMTPMIDMSFLLITFFVMTLRLSYSTQHPIELPRADQAKTTHAAPVAIATLVVDWQGRIFAGKRELSLADVENDLQQRRDAEPKLKLVLRADARSPFERVRDVMRAAAEAGVDKVSLAALKTEEQKP
jgi:biopolymer transport protein ExbD